MTVELSERQRYWYEHLRQADDQQVSLAQYAREQGLQLKQLYGAKTWLVKLGAWPRGASRATTPSSEFVAVRVAPYPVSPRCRLSHVSGWNVECDHWPEASWLRSLVVVDAAT